MSPKKCDVCEEATPDVRERNDPFAAVEDRDDPMNLCDDCEEGLMEDAAHEA
jgi:hypothetical protein